MDKPILTDVTYTFIQEGNTDGTTAETEELIIKVEGCMNILDSGGYLVLKTSTGWSVNDSSELIEILEIVEKLIPNGKKN